MLIDDAVPPTQRHVYSLALQFGAAGKLANFQVMAAMPKQLGMLTKKTCWTTPSL